MGRKIPYLEKKGRQFEEKTAKVEDHYFPLQLLAYFLLLMEVMAVHPLESV